MTRCQLPNTNHFIVIVRYDIHITEVC